MTGFYMKFNTAEMGYLWLLLIFDYYWNKLSVSFDISVHEHKSIAYKKNKVLLKSKSNFMPEGCSRFTSSSKFI